MSAARAWPCLIVVLLAGCVEDATSPVRDGPAARPQYAVPFDPLTATSGTALLTDISDNGTIVGYFDEGGEHKLYWQTTSASGTIVEGPQLFGFGVNDAGVIVGAGAIGGGAYFEARYWRIDGETGVLQGPSGATTSVAYAVGPGEYPIIVGYSWSTFGPPVPVRWDMSPTGVTLTVLPTADQGGFALALNTAAGLIVGRAGLDVATWDLATNALAIEPVVGMAYDINDAGYIVGDSHQGRAFMIEPDGTILTLGANSTHARFQGVNNDNVAVGWIQRGEGELKAIAWRSEMGQTPFVLGELGSDARAINDSYLAVGVSGSVGALTGGTWTVDPDFDADEDGHSVWADNCPTRANPDQADADSDGTGNYCDADYPPVITRASVNRTTGYEGRALRFTAGGFDPGRRTLTWSWSFSDGPGALDGAAVNHAFGDQGSFTAAATANNGAGGVSTSEPIALTILNVVPELTVIPPATPAAGVAQNLHLEISDDGAADAPFAYTVNWGDGTETTGECTNHAGCALDLAHTWSAPRDYRITVTVTDKDAGSRVGRYRITVE